MLNPTLRRLTLLTTLLSCACNQAFADKINADYIMKQSDDRYTGDTQLSESTLTLIDKKGRERVRELKLFGIDKDKVEKSLIFFMSPSDVEGTAYMSFDWEDESKEDDAWLYLPALQKIKRVASSDESGAFMGSDFSYADINGLDYEDFTYRLLKENEQVDGEDCWVIESTPKDKSIIDKTGYTSAQTWVRKDNFMQVKSIIQLEKARKVKYFVARDIEKIQDVWTAKTLQMVTTRNDKKEHASVLKLNNIRYNDKVDESMFDTQAMQRGI
ncbi:hypothetical protein TDB9533_00225 [Thalassocella blandensis]|nr:hypothetical protein TDB9533_00225 [Thalassocella blandensis]